MSHLSHFLHQYQFVLTDIALYCILTTSTLHYYFFPQNSHRFPHLIEFLKYIPQLMEIKNIRKIQMEFVLYFFLLIESKVICISFKTNKHKQILWNLYFRGNRKAVVALRCSSLPIPQFPFKKCNVSQRSTTKLIHYIDIKWVMRSALSFIV